VSPDLQLAFRLADVADAVTSPPFRSESLQVITKSDGTPVTEVDRATEAAMQSIVERERPGDAFLGEEIGPIGASGRRWIFDGIDGTHNYAAGRAAWATMIALEVDGEIEVGMVTSPFGGLRWYAERGGGAYRMAGAPATPGSPARYGAPEPLHVSAVSSLDEATVLPLPPGGFMLGWRSEVAPALERGTPERNRTFAYEGAAVAAGALDAAVILNGGPWDFAANAVIVEEAGGHCCDLWGGRRLDTTTIVFTNGRLTDDILAIAARFRPDEPDEAVRNPDFRPPSLRS
jgi:histidinol-phosphatase